MPAEIEAGWLAKTIEDAEHDRAVKFTPMELVRQGSKVTLPLEPDKAAALYRALDARFYAWTGRSLKEWSRDNAC